MQAALFEFLKSNTTAQLIGVADEKEALSSAHVAKYLNKPVYILPDLRAQFGEDLLAYKEEIEQLLNALKAYYQNPSSKKLLICPIRTLNTPLPPKEIFDVIKLAFGDTLKLSDFKSKMLNWGYNIVDVVESSAEVSFRGDIIDIFPIDKELPLRFSLFDDEIESIRFFEPATQKSYKEELEEVNISPALFALNDKEYEQLQDEAKKMQSDSFVKDIHSLGLWLLKPDTKGYLESFETYLQEDIQEDIEEIRSFDEDFATSLDEKKRIPQAQKFKTLQMASVKNFLEFHKNKRITILAKNDVLLRQHGLEGDYKFIQSDLIVNLISDDEVILSLNKESKKRRRKKASIILDELNIGDYVVHENYGVGVFKGLQNTTVLGSTRDFVVLEYQGDDRLLLPVENLDIIDRYISEGGHLAVLDRLGKGSFQKLKAKTKAKLFEIASQIIDMAAKREMIDALSLQKDEKLLAFQQDAGFEYTTDQQSAVEDIIADLSSGKMMDRLLSGDVGFGKTEVAMNAMLLAAMNNYQSIMIAPTTLLSSQHFKSLNERFKPYNIRVEKLDRFTTTNAKKQILADLKSGELKICVGTHSLLSVELYNPALIVVDEEHKFGVKQKEKIKSLRQNAHILSMSATPIPRSLNMALSSIKQYSQLLTPPSDREDIRTFVKEYDEKSLKEAILREVRRGGQVFFVHNRIAGIAQKQKELEALMPGIKILPLHSKISATVTEKEMINFENKKYDILLSTSIIESGIHIPNVNTIIIDGADTFGIADLHQMRGRVGRGKRQGYCYFIVKDKSKLTDQSKKRLLALESNSYLGSGSVLAYHDLEIRGGGNLIGEAQSGHIKNIGYTLYLKMLEDSINELLNNTPVAKKEVDIKLTVSGFISSDYISEDRVRLELYRRLSKCSSVSEVLEIEEEMLDRFGKLDVPTTQFLQIITIKILAAKANILAIANYNQNITLKDDEDKKELIKAPSKDDDDILATVLVHLRKRAKA